MSNTTEVTNSTAEKFMQLYLELLEARKNKKDLVKAANEEIKRIDEEIEELLEQEGEKREEMFALADKAELKAIDENKDVHLEEQEE